MSSIGNIRNLTSIGIHTLHKGSTIERIVVGSILLGVGFIIAQNLYRLAIFFFSTRQGAGESPKPNLPNGESKHLTPLQQKLLAAYNKELDDKYSVSAPVVAPNSKPSGADAQEHQSHSALAKLSINGIELPDDMKASLAEALYLYDELRKKINGEEERFEFITKSFLENGGLLANVKWEARKEELKVPQTLTAAFVKAQEALTKVGLDLRYVSRVSKAFAKAEFRSGDPKEIFTLAELYQTIKLQGPDILSPLEIRQKTQKIESAKQQVHASRLKIIEKTLSTVRTLLINDMVKDFPEKHKELYPLFGNDSSILLFVVENVCWHILDKTLESIEVTVVPSKEKQQKIRKIDLESSVAKILSDKAKQTEAQGFLLQILADPNNEAPVQSLVNLLRAAGDSSEIVSLIRKLQQPKLEIEEGFIQQELARLEAIQQFYHALAVATAVADEGKNALIKGAGQGDNEETITSRPLPAVPDELLRSTVAPPNTYGQAVEEVSAQVVAASERAILGISGQKWHDYLTSLTKQLEKINGVSVEIVNKIVQDGWVKFNNKQALMPLTGPQRWLLTKKMIIQKIAENSLQEKGTQLVQEVGKGVASFIKTLYGRLISVLHDFDKRTKEVGQNDSKPADRVAKSLFDSLLLSYQALMRVKKDKGYADKVGEREEGVVKELEKLGEIHANATNKGSADAVFLASLILRLLFILLPEGLSADIQKAIMSAVRQGRSGESKTLQKAIEMYNKSIQPAVAPWVKPIGNFLFQALQTIIERQSASNVAKQMSELLNPININFVLVELLKADNTDFAPAKDAINKSKSLVWYESDEREIAYSLELRELAKLKIEEVEKRLEALKKEKGNNENLLKEWREKKLELARKDMDLFRSLLKRAVVTKVPRAFAGYVLQFSYDLYELIQYPRILRHVVFNVMEKIVHTLQPLNIDEPAALLNEAADLDAQQSLVNFIFSNQQKTHIGNTISELLWVLQPTETASGMVGWLTQTAVKTAAKTAATVLPGSTIFSGIQTKVESLVITKFNDPEAVKWSGAKLIGWLNSKILTLAADKTKTGMTAKITALLEQALKEKEEEKTVPIPQAVTN